MTVRDGSAEWRGDALTGAGKVTIGDGVFSRALAGVPEITISAKLG
jgi:hypothetical protein